MEKYSELGYPLVEEGTHMDGMGKIVDAEFKKMNNLENEFAKKANHGEKGKINEFTKKFKELVMYDLCWNYNRIETERESDNLLEMVPKKQ